MFFNGRSRDSRSIRLLENYGAMSQELVYKVAERTHVGKVRKKNQDDVWHGQTPIGFFYVVADGMGGHQGGEIASNLVVNLLMQRCARSDPNSDPIAIIKDSLFRANIEIFKKGALNPELYGMGSTAVAVLIKDGKAYVAHVGDSRIYLYRAGALHRLTIDHTLVQMLIESGIMNEEEAKNHPRSHILNSAVGCHPDALVDILPEAVKLQGGDVIMLCTDGLHGLVSDVHIERVLARETTPDVMASDLIDMALSAGGTDNVTVQVIKVIGPKEDPLPVPVPKHAPPPRDDIENTKKIILNMQDNKRKEGPPVWMIIAIGTVIGLLVCLIMFYILWIAFV